MIKPIKGYSILRYEPPEHWKETAGIILPSQAMMRDYLREKEHKTFDAADVPPDVYRWGVLVAGDLDVPENGLVYFNRHDADEFEVEGIKYHRINNKNALAFYVQPNTNTRQQTITYDETSSTNAAA